jgi:SAM-dependent methyltransferase
MDVASHLTTYRPDRDRAFDRRYGTDTAGAVDTSALGIDSDERREQAILYLPSPVRVTRWMLESVGIEHGDFTFVDLGCGKGRVLLVAAQYPFRRILGVDISAELTSIARSNAERFRHQAGGCKSIDIVNADATTIDFPETDLLLHLYHPFDPAVTRAVLRRLEASLKGSPRRVRVAYLLYTGAVPAVRGAFSEFGWLREARYAHSLLGNYDWLFYSNG